MGYTDSLLAEGEVVAMRGRQHWLALLLDSRAAIGVWVLAAVLFAANIIFRITGDASRLIGYVVLALLVIGLVIFAYRWLRWVNQAYLVTNRRILKVEGILNKRSMDSSLEKINDLVLEENILGRMLDYGDLDIVTASDVAIDRFRMLNHAKTFKKEMLDQKLQLEQGDFYRPSPPIMATTPAVAAQFAPPPAPTEPAEPSPVPTPPTTFEPGPAPETSFAPEPAAEPEWAAAPSSSTASGSTPPAAPSPAPASELAADEAAARGATVGADDEDDETRDVTRTLARLADLRDRGAITAEDYDAKKTELLGRL
jgi:hypothetical protein